MGERNEKGGTLELFCVNTGFTKPEKHLITYMSGGVRSQIDYMLVRRRERKRVINCKVIPGEACVKQHRIVVMDIKWKKIKELR